MFKIAGVIGLLLIVSGVLTKKRKTQNVLFMLGGVFLTAYSVYLQDLIFIVLQVVFILAAAYDYVAEARR